MKKRKVVFEIIRRPQSARARRRRIVFKMKKTRILVTMSTVTYYSESLVGFMKQWIGLAKIGFPDSTESAVAGEPVAEDLTIGDKIFTNVKLVSVGNCK